MNETSSLDLRVAAIRDETDRIRVFTLAADGPLPGYTAGAHLDFDLGDVGTRSYSLIEWQAPDDPPTSYTIAVQREPDGQGGSARMHAFAVGDRLSASPPKNDFPLAGGDGPTLLLAGGIGVTPLISMATTLEAAGRPFVFHFAARSRSVMGFREALAARFPDQLVTHFDDEAPIDLAGLLGGLDPATHLYVCGPKGMIEAAKAAAPLPPEQVHFELFTTPAPAEGDSAFEVEIHDTGQVFAIPPGRTIIEVLEEAGLDLVYDCQRGDCGICQTDVIAGEPDHRDVVLSEAERASGKVMQICVGRAKSDRLVLDL